MTNLRPRPTRRADELTREEIRAVAVALRANLEYLEPRAVAYTGIGIYKWFRAIPKVSWGVQEETAVPSVADTVVPSPSGLKHYHALTPFLA